MSEKVYDFDAIIRKVNENVNSKVSAISSINDIKSKYQDKVQYLVISENDGNINRNDTLVVSKNIPDFLLKSNITDLHGAFQKKCKPMLEKLGASSTVFFKSKNEFDSLSRRNGTIPSAYNSKIKFIDEIVSNKTQKVKSSEHDKKLNSPSNSLLRRQKTLLLFIIQQRENCSVL